MGNNQTKEEEVPEQVIRTEEEKFLEGKIIETLEAIENGVEYTSFTRYSNFSHNNYGRSYSTDAVFRPRDYPYHVKYYDWVVTDKYRPSVSRTKWNMKEFMLDLINENSDSNNFLRIEYYRIRKNKPSSNDKSDDIITYRMFFVTNTVNITMKSGDKYSAKIVFCNTLVTNADYSECKVTYSMEYMIPEVSPVAYPCTRIPKDAFIPKFWLEDFEEIDIGVIKKRVEKDRVIQGDGKLTKAIR